jgi:DNA-directed RNA polymerase I, II, and III subunit RPABC3
MSQKNVLFEDNLRISEIDREGKAFEKVSRAEGITEDSECKIQIDINSDIYPISKDSYYSIMITKSLFADGSPSPNSFNIEMYTKKNSLMEKFDYVMHGKIFKYSEERNGEISIYASFGGLLFGITGEPSHLSNLSMDERVYLLLKKLN